MITFNLTPIQLFTAAAAAEIQLLDKMALLTSPRGQRHRQQHYMQDINNKIIYSSDYDADLLEGVYSAAGLTDLLWTVGTDPAASLRKLSSWSGRNGVPIVVAQHPRPDSNCKCFAAQLMSVFQAYPAAIEYLTHHLKPGFTQLVTRFDLPADTSNFSSKRVVSSVEVFYMTKAKAAGNASILTLSAWLTASGKIEDIVTAKGLNNALKDSYRDGADNPLSYMVAYRIPNETYKFAITGEGNKRKIIHDYDSKRKQSDDKNKPSFQAYSDDYVILYEAEFTKWFDTYISNIKSGNKKSKETALNLEELEELRISNPERWIKIQQIDTSPKTKSKRVSGDNVTSGLTSQEWKRVTNLVQSHLERSDYDAAILALGRYTPRKGDSYDKYMDAKRELEAKIEAASNSEEESADE